MDRVLNSICGRAEEDTPECMDFLSELDTGGGVV